MKRSHKLALGSVVLLVAACLLAYWAAHRGFYVEVENRSSATVEALRLLYEDGAIDLGTLHPGGKARARFRPRPTDAEGGDFTLEGNLKADLPTGEDRPVGMGLFVTRGKSLSLRLVDVTDEHGRRRVRLEGEGRESFDPYRYAVRAWNRDWPGQFRFPPTVLDEDD